MKFTFCLPNTSKQASGGYKIIFEYANRLVERGHEVSLIFLTHTQYSKYTSNLAFKQMVGQLFNLYYPRWFKLRPQVKKVATAYIDGRDFPDADVVFATAVETAKIVNDLPNRCGKKAYFIQDFENWSFTDEQVVETYRYGFTNVTVASWLKHLVSQYDPDVYLIKNPIDTEVFCVKTPPEQRNPFSIGMLYHFGEYKGCQQALEAIAIVKKKYPQLQLHLFGTPEAPDFLEDWMTYTRKATSEQLVELYNTVSIFVCASIQEGFGLTGAESMACGCAYASTSYEGVFEYAVANHNALLSPIGDVEALAGNIIQLIENRTLRYSLAKQAAVDLSQFSWEEALVQLEKIFQ